MKRERDLYIMQMKRWMNGYGSKWLCAAVTVQAVTNSLDLCC
jgi:hypothetical protein